MVARPAVRPARRPARLGVIAACLVASCAVAGLLGAPARGLVYVVPTVLAVLLQVGERRRERALARLASLPFSIEHSRRSALDAQSSSAIRSATIRLAHRIDRPALERMAGDAQVRAPGLVLQSEGDAIVITAWPWGGDDVLLLADLLSAWAQALHGDHAIVGATVTWAPGGPPPSL